MLAGASLQSGANDPGSNPGQGVCLGSLAEEPQGSNPDRQGNDTPPKHFMPL